MPAASATALEDNGDRFVPALIAVLVHLAIVALAAMLLVGGSAERWREERDSRLIVQLATFETEEARAAAVENALTRIRGFAEVARAERLPEDRLAGLLQPWPGAAPLASGVPLPTVIELELEPEARASADSVRLRLQAELPDAEIDRSRALLDPALRLMHAIERVALMLVVVLGGTLAAVVVFATQARLAARHETIEILHLLGADDAGIVEAVVRRALRTATIGGLIGFALGATTLLVFARAATTPGIDRITEYSLSPAAWVGLAAPPLAAAAIAAITARLTARRALAAMP
jgi:cell division transport system permease protein